MTKQALLLVALAAAVAFGAWAYQGRGAGGPLLADPPLAVDFPVFSLGDSFEGLPLTGVTRRLDADSPLDPVTANYVGFRYGDCDLPAGDAGCAPPLQVQVWPACERTRSTYTIGGRPLPREDTALRGVPASFFEEGRRLELYTDRATVVLFGTGRGQLVRAAQALRGVSGSDARAGEPLPPLLLPFHRYGTFQPCR